MGLEVSNMNNEGHEASARRNEMGWALARMANIDKYTIAENYRE